MKIRTNLSDAELQIVAKGLTKAATPPAKPYKPENQAETELLRRIENSLEIMTESLQEELSDLLLKD